MHNKQTNKQTNKQKRSYRLKFIKDDIKQVDQTQV